MFPNTGSGALSVATDPALSQTTPTTASTNSDPYAPVGGALPSSSHAASTTASGRAGTTIPACDAVV